MRFGKRTSRMRPYEVKMSTSSCIRQERRNLVSRLDLCETETERRCYGCQLGVGWISSSVGHLAIISLCEPLFRGQQYQELALDFLPFSSRSLSPNTFHATERQGSPLPQTRFQSNFQVVSFSRYRARKCEVHSSHSYFSGLRRTVQSHPRC